MKKILVSRQIFFDVLGIGLALFWAVATTTMAENKPDNMHEGGNGQRTGAVFHGNDGDGNALENRIIEVFVQCRFDTLTLEQNQTSGAVSYISYHGSDFNGQEDTACYYGIFGYISHLFDLGSAAFAIDYGNSE